MANKEAAARIKINKLLEAAGWRFFPDRTKPANIILEPGVTIKSSELDANPVSSFRDFKAVPKKYRTLILKYDKDYVPPNQFAA